MARKHLISGDGDYVAELSAYPRIIRVCNAQVYHYRGCGITDNHPGVIAKSTDRYLPQPIKSQTGPTYTAVDEDIEIEEEQEEPPEPVRILDQVSTYDQVIVWGHDRLPGADDPFVKGVEEWVSFAESIHGKPAEKASSQQNQPDSIP